MARDIDFCYRLVVCAAQVLGNQNPTNREILEVLREFHRRERKRLPRLCVLKAALRDFRRAGSQLPTAFSRRVR